MPEDIMQYACNACLPRRDQPERYDQQTSFLYSEHPGVTILLGGNGAGTTTMGLRKAIDFMMKTPPPRRDTPFWFLADTLEMSMGVIWKEKMDQQRHLPPQEIDRERIRWHRPNANWPFAVPLKEWPGRPGKNWICVFRSYEQGRAKMAGESIGGFLFVEQFPQEILSEVLRGCREYAFTGNKLVEQTPVDPSMSVWIQEMEENNTLPPGWAIYRCNTECAVEAGHVTRQWFDQFFGMIPKAMREVRMKGLWGNYEGLVYPEFNAAIHCIAESEWEMPPAVYHRKAIDYGQGPENPFACIWMCRDGQGRWTAYDEYYSTEPISPIEHLKRIQEQEVLWPDSPYYGMTWADPSALGAIRIAARLQDYAPGYRSMNIQGANHNRDEGINHVRWLLDVHDELIGPNGKPQPMLSIVKEKCPNLIKEFRTHRYLQSSGLGLNPASARLDVLKRDDHLLDCCRYLCYSEHLQTGVTPQMIQRERATPKGMQFESKKFKRGGRTLE